MYLCGNWGGVEEGAEGQSAPLALSGPEHSAPGGRGHQRSQCVANAGTVRTETLTPGGRGHQRLQGVANCSDIASAVQRGQVFLPQWEEAVIYT